MDEQEELFIHNFKITGNDEELPEVLEQTFENYEDFVKYFTENFNALHNQLHADRLYTAEELEEFDNKILEAVKVYLPPAEDELAEAEYQLSLAKKTKEDASNQVSAIYGVIRDYRKEIKTGTAELFIEAEKVFEIPFKDKYFSYVLLDDGRCVLAKVREIPENEKNNLFNSLEMNEETVVNILLGNGKNKGKTKHVSQIIEK